MSVNNPRFPHSCEIIRFAKSEDPMSDEETGIVIYKGSCRGYSKLTTSVSGEVLSSYRGLALPLKQDEWTSDTIPQEGDKIVLDKGSYKEYGEVIDRMPGNLGTHLLWRYVRN
jgi:hypothetical protein